MEGGLSSSTDSETGKSLAPACRKKADYFSKTLLQNCFLKKHVVKEKEHEELWNREDLGSNTSSASYQNLTPSLG